MQYGPVPGELLSRSCAQAVPRAPIWRLHGVLVQDPPCGGVWVRELDHQRIGLRCTLVRGLIP